MHEFISRLKLALFNKDPLKDPAWIVKKSTHVAYIREGCMYVDKSLVAHDYRTASAESQYINHLLKASASRVVDALLSQAAKKPTDSWRKTRNAIAYTYASVGAMKIAEKIKKLENPVKPEDRPGKSGRRSRRKDVTHDEFILLLENRLVGKDYDAANLLILCRYLGIRPCDAISLQVSKINANEILVVLPPGKETERGKFNDKHQRGLERELILPAHKAIESAILHWGPRDGKKTKTTDDIKRATARIVHVAKKLIPPKRGQHFVMYSLRYDMGAELKAAYLDDPEGAKILSAVLGQRSASSASPYGDKRSARGGRGIALPRPTQKTIDGVRDDRRLGVRPTTMRIRAQNNPRRRISKAAIAKRDSVRKPSRLDKKVLGRFANPNLGHGLTPE